MPIIWRYLLAQYLKVLGICTVTFVTVLMSTRLDDVAKFATLGTEGKMVISFLLYQIPYILPIAIPISCVISSVLLFQQLSNTHQLTAMRACGLAMRQITSPILLAAVALSLVNFYVVSEMATQSHLATRQLENQIKSLNPMLLLQNRQLLKMRGFYADVMGPSKAGELATDVVLAMNNRHYKRLNLLLAKRINATDQSIDGEKITLITGTAPKDHQGFDHLMLETIDEVHTPIEDFRKALRREGWRLSTDHLKMSLLLVRTRDFVSNLRHAREEGLSEGEIYHMRRRLNGCITEIARRVSVAVAVFAFTLMGASFGVSISRFGSKRGIGFVIGMVATYLTCFFLAKDLDHVLVASTALYIAPLVLIIGLSIWNLKRLTQGVE